MVIKRFMAVALLIALSAVARSADPTQPPHWLQPALRKSEPLPELTLQQIRISDSDAVAVINNRLVRVGDDIDGATVIAIKAGTVDVKIRQKRQKLSLLNNTRQYSE